MTIKQDIIYSSFERNFSRDRCFAILKDGKGIGLLAIKYPADGAGRVTAYLHIFGLPMARGSAGGYGYDKATAAVVSAAAGLVVDDRMDSESACAGAIRDGMKDNGYDFGRQLTDLGFTLARGC